MNPWICSDIEVESLHLRHISHEFAYHSIAGPGPVSELKAETGFTSIILTWNAPEELTGVIIGYEVTYSVNGGSLMSVNSTDAASTFTISLLTPSTAIQDITVAAYTREGRGEVTGLAGVRTLAETQLRELRTRNIVEPIGKHNGSHSCAF